MAQQKTKPEHALDDPFTGRCENAGWAAGARMYASLLPFVMV